MLGQLAALSATHPWWGNRHFENVALGSGAMDDQRAASLVRQSKGVLDHDALWSGLHTAFLG